MSLSRLLNEARRLKAKMMLRTRDGWAQTLVDWLKGSEPSPKLRAAIDRAMAELDDPMEEPQPGEPSHEPNEGVMNQ